MSGVRGPKGRLNQTLLYDYKINIIVKASMSPLLHILEFLIYVIKIFIYLINMDFQANLRVPLLIQQTLKLTTI
jgi:hypothetical protein